LEYRIDFDHPAFAAFADAVGMDAFSGSVQVREDACD
jgi:hypothetical protein